MKEAGVADLESTGWWGVFLPANTPAPIVAKLSDELQLVMKQPDVIESLHRMGIESAPLPTSEFQPFFQKELKSYDDVARQFNLVVN